MQQSQLVFILGSLVTSLLVAGCAGDDGEGQTSARLSGNAVYRDAATDHAGNARPASPPPAQTAEVAIVVKGQAQIPEVDPQCALDPTGHFEAHYLGDLRVGDDELYLATLAAGSGAITTPSGCAIPQLTVGLVTEVVVRAELAVTAQNCETYCQAHARAEAEAQCGASAAAASCRGTAEAQVAGSCTTTCTTSAHAIVAEASLAAGLFGSLDAEALRGAALGETRGRPDLRSPRRCQRRPAVARGQRVRPMTAHSRVIASGGGSGRSPGDDVELGVGLPAQVGAGVPDREQRGASRRIGPRRGEAGVVRASRARGREPRRRGGAIDGGPARPIDEQVARLPRDEDVAARRGPRQDPAIRGRGRQREGGEGLEGVGLVQLGQQPVARVDPAREGRCDPAIVEHRLGLVGGQHDLRAQGAIGAVAHDDREVRMAATAVLADHAEHDHAAVGGDRREPLELEAVVDPPQPRWRGCRRGARAGLVLERRCGCACGAAAGREREQQRDAHATRRA